MKLNKRDVVDSIAEDVGLTKAEIDYVLRSLVDLVAEIMRAGHTVELRGLGTFSTRTLKAKTGRNPKTGETIQVPERVKPRFKFSNSVTKGM